MQKNYINKIIHIFSTLIISGLQNSTFLGVTFGLPGWGILKLKVSLLKCSRIFAHHEPVNPPRNSSRQHANLVHEERGNYSFSMEFLEPCSASTTAWRTTVASTSLDRFPKFCCSFYIQFELPASC